MKQQIKRAKKDLQDALSEFEKETIDKGKNQIAKL